MSVLLLVLVFGVGLLVGVVGLVVLADRLALSEAGRERLAQAEAERRVRAVQTQALHEMARAGEEAIRRSTVLGFTDRDIDEITKPEVEVIDGEVVEANEGRWS